MERNGLGEDLGDGEVGFGGGASKYVEPATIAFGISKGSEELNIWNFNGFEILKK